MTEHAASSNQSPTDSRVRRAMLPMRVLWHSDNVQGADALLKNDWGQALAQPVACCTLHGANAGILLDFGRELHGSLQLVSGPTPGNAVIRLRLRFGESASEAMGEPNNDHAIHDTIIAVPPMGAQEFGLTGFRFARLDLLDDLELPLVAARAMTLMHDSAPIGSFSCSDERLNRIWQVGADTVHLCMQDLLWDGIKRDRLVWMGDLHPEVSVISAVWGAHPIVPQSLDWVRDYTPLPEWMNGIGSYSMWWVIIQRDWFQHHGDRAYLETQRAYLLGLLPVLIEQIQPDGGAAWRGPQFLDWPSSPYPTAVSAGLHALLLMTLQAGAELCAVLDEPAARAGALEAAARLRQQVPPLPIASKQASALLALASLCEVKHVNEQSLAREPLSGLSTFYGFYVLEARALAGDVVGCLEVLRHYWGAMLGLGATSFWEDFDLSWAQNAGRIDELPVAGQSDLHRERGDYCYKGYRHSLCHGWAAGPTAWLSRWVLGCVPLKPGCRRLSVQPHLGDLDWAEGVFPTPYGPVAVRHEKARDGKAVSQVTAPPEVEVVRLESSL